MTNILRPPFFVAQPFLFTLTQEVSVRSSASSVTCRGVACYTRPALAVRGLYTGKDTGLE
jgi:hypothetical protein